MAFGFAILSTLWKRESKSDKPVFTRLSGRRSFQRKINHSFLRIREIRKDDEQRVRGLLFEHFRQLTFPAIVYWIVQHVYDLLAIIAILSFLLPIKHILYFVVAFLVYLYVRARCEMEKHIRYSCPDLTNIHETYLSARGANFWVGYFSNQDKPENGSEDGASNAESSREASSCVTSGDERPDIQAPSGTDDHTTENKEEENVKEQPTEVEGDASENGSNGEKQKQGKQKATEEDAPMSLKDLLNQTKCKENEILGCIGIAPYRNKSTIAQMVRLVVSKKCRSMKVGSKLLSHLEKYAIDFGYTEIRVYTNNLNTAYLQFLKQNGFVIQQLVRRGLMRGDLIIWNKTLSQPKDLLAPETEAITNMGVTLILE